MYMVKDNLKEIEVDVDGVLADMDGAYGDYVKDLIPDWTEEKYVTGWNMPEVEKNYPEAYKRIRGLYSNSDFVYSLERYPNVVEGMKELKEILKGKGNTVVHTHIFTDITYDSRYNWLVDLQRDSNYDFDIDICVGPQKSTRENSYVTIEDNILNLNKSNAEYKFLVRRCHNKEYGVNDIKNCKKAYVVDSFYSAVQEIRKIFEGNELS